MQTLTCFLLRLCFRREDEAPTSCGDPAKIRTIPGSTRSESDERAGEAKSPDGFWRRAGGLAFEPLMQSDFFFPPSVTQHLHTFSVSLSTLHKMLNSLYDRAALL